jgi:hypothetical protein
MSQHRRAKITARIEDAPEEERGRILIVLWCHAVASTAVNGGLAAGVASSGVRIWRRRDQGWVPAVRAGGHWRMVAGFALASAGLRAVGHSITNGIATAPR